MKESKIELHTTKSMNKKRKHKKHGAFIKGPVQLLWITKACKLNKSAIKVALAICFLEGIYRGTEFKLENAIFKEFGIDRQAKSRGLKALKQAGLIEIKQDRGALPRVKMLKITKNI